MSTSQGSSRYTYRADKVFSDPVPAEATGRARLFVQGCEAAGLQRRALAEAVVEPLKARLRKHPGRCIRAELLQQAAQRWRAESPAFGRLGCKIEASRKELKIAEIRCERTSFRYLRWGDDRHEDGIAIGVMSISVDPNGIDVDMTFNVVVGFHSLRRYCQRSWLSSDAALCDALGRLMLAEKSIVAAAEEDGCEHEFECRISSNENDDRWCGDSVISQIHGVNQRLLVTRTFKNWPAE